MVWNLLLPCYSPEPFLSLRSTPHLHFPSYRPTPVLKLWTDQLNPSEPWFSYRDNRSSNKSSMIRAISCPSDNRGLALQSTQPTELDLLIFILAPTFKERLYTL